MSRRGHLTASLLLLTLAAAACAPPTRPAAEPSQSANIASQASSTPKRITAAIRGFPKSISVTIDSAGAGSTAGLYEVEQLAHAGLAVVQGDGELRPRLAQTIPSITNGLWKLFPDGRMETTWSLRPGLRWHDGVPFTTQDLVFTAGVARDKELPIVIDAGFDFVDSVEASDPQALTIRWKQPFIEAELLFSHARSARVLPMPKHLLEKTYLEDRANFAQAPYWNEAFVGLGPFKVKEWMAGSYTLLEANELYTLGRPKIDAIEVKFIGDATVTVANVLAGAVDITLGRGLSLEQSLQARDVWRDGRVDNTVNGTTSLFPQFFNPVPAVVADVRFRRAVTHALDRQQLAQTLQAGLSPVAHAPINPNEPEFQAIEGSVVMYDYDPRKAVQLIESLGYTRGPDGIFRDSAQQRLAVKMQTTIDDLREKMILIVADYWQQAGVAMEPVIIPRQLSDDRQVRSTFPSFDTSRPDIHPTRFHSSGIPLPENGFRGNNRSRYTSAELDALIDKYFVTIPREERLQLLSGMVRHITDQLVVIGVFFLVEPALINNRLVNVLPRKGEDALHPWNAHEWDVKS